MCIRPDEVVLGDLALKYYYGSRAYLLRGLTNNALWGTLSVHIITAYGISQAVAIKFILKEGMSINIEIK